MLQAFEAAEISSDPRERAEWLTFVVIGAGPSGLAAATEASLSLSKSFP